MSSWATWLPSMGKTLGQGALEAGPTILGVASAVRQGKDARLQADMLRENARAARAQGARDEEAQRREARIALGRQFAAAAEAGGGTGGSAGQLLEQSAVLAELDALNIRYGADNRARGYQAKSLSLRGRARNAGLLAGAQLLTGIARNRTRDRMLREE